MQLVFLHTIQECIDYCIDNNLHHININEMEDRLIKKSCYKNGDLYIFLDELGILTNTELSDYLD